MTVRHKDESLIQKYGIMEVWEIKGDFATYRYGDYYNLKAVTVIVSDLINA